MMIKVYDDDRLAAECTVDEMVSIAPGSISLVDRVPGSAGRAFDVKQWYRQWNRQRHESQQPTHFKVEAIDGFQALIPWPQMDTACFLYEQEGQPLKKAYPLRLYVPDGSSECLNVKSVVKIYFLNNGQLGGEASYGFNNHVSVEQLKKTTK